MRNEVILAGFGGQGIMSMGKNLIKAGMEEGKEVTWVPSYGPEMRGGTSNCSVIISDDRIGSPLIEHPTEIIVMNLPSLNKFIDSVTPNGIVFINSDIINEKVEREDVRTFYIPCDSIARDLGNAKVANMVILGAYIGATKILQKETIEKMIESMFSGAKSKLIPLNIKALEEGMKLVS